MNSLELLKPSSPLDQLPSNNSASLNDRQVLTALVHLQTTASQRTSSRQWVISVDKILQARASLLSLIDPASNKLRELVIKSVQKMLEARSDLYKVEQIVAEPALPSMNREALNLLVKSITGVMVERMNFLKLYVHIMSRLFLSTIQAELARSEQCFRSTPKGVLALDFERCKKMTPESFSLCARLEHAKTMKVKTLHQELKQILQEEKSLESDTRIFLEFWKKIYLLNVAQSISSAFEESFKETVLCKKVEVRFLLVSKETKELATLHTALLLNDDLNSFYTEQAETA